MRHGDPFAALTARERELAELIAQGSTTPRSPRASS